MPTPTARRSGPRPPTGSTGARSGTRSSSGRTRRSPSGSSAASSTPRSTAWTATSTPATATRSPCTGTASAGDTATSRTPTSRTSCRGRQRPHRARRQAGRPGRDLHADDPRGRRRDARLRPDRRPAHRRLRRLLRRRPRRPHRRLRRQGRHHRRRRLPPRRGKCAQARVDEAVEKTGDRCEHVLVVRRTGQDVAWTRAATSGGTTPSTARRPSTRPRCTTRAPALHPLHLRHDRQAEGHPAHHRRLPDRASFTHWRSSTSSRRPTSTGAPPTSAG